MEPCPCLSRAPLLLPRERIAQAPLSPSPMPAAKQKPLVGDGRLDALPATQSPRGQPSRVCLAGLLGTLGAVSADPLTACGYSWGESFSSEADSWLSHPMARVGDIFL